MMLFMAVLVNAQPPAFTHLQAGTVDTSTVLIDPGPFTTQGFSNTLQYDGTRLRFTADNSRQRQIVQVGSTAYVASNSGTISGTSDDIGLLNALVADVSDITYNLPASPLDGDRYYFVLAGGYDGIINGNGKSVNGGSSYSITEPFTVLTVQFQIYANQWVAW